MELNANATLEKLRDHIRKKYESEWKNLPVADVLQKQSEILNMFELSPEQYEYASAIVYTTEEQSVKKTIINTSKAKYILIKRRNK